MNAVDQAIAEYPFLTPWAAARGRFKTGAAFAASNIRALLKHGFPNTRFSVKSETYAGGDSVNISWADLPGAPSQNEVDGAVVRFQDGSWDGMEDLYRYEKSGQGFRTAFGGVRFVSARQRWPNVAEISAIPTERLNEADGDGNTLLHRLAKRNAPPVLVQLLVKAGADLNAKNALGHSPIEEGLNTGWGYSGQAAPVIEVLLRNGAELGPYNRHFERAHGMSPAIDEILNARAQARGLAVALPSVTSRPRHDFGAPEPLERLDRPARRRL